MGNMHVFAGVVRRTVIEAAGHSLVEVGNLLVADEGLEDIDFACLDDNLAACLELLPYLVDLGNHPLVAGLGILPSVAGHNPAEVVHNLAEVVRNLVEADHTLAKAIRNLADLRNQVGVVHILVVRRSQAGVVHTLVVVAHTLAVAGHSLVEADHNLAEAVHTLVVVGHIVESVEDQDSLVDPEVVALAFQLVAFPLEQLMRMLVLLEFAFHSPEPTTVQPEPQEQLSVTQILPLSVKVFVVQQFELHPSVESLQEELASIAFRHASELAEPEAGFQVVAGGPEVLQPRPLPLQPPFRVSQSTHRAFVSSLHTNFRPLVQMKYEAESHQLACYQT